MPLPDHKTRIVATIGPASEAPAVLEAMIQAGLDVARLNFSHGDFDTHRRVIGSVRAASKAAGRRVAIMADLSGPKMRIGQLGKETIGLKAGDPFTLTTDDIVGDAQRVSVSFARLPKVVKPGDLLSLNDGFIQLEVATVRGTEVACVVKVGGELRSRKGLNLPGVDLGIRAFTERDRECLEFAPARWRCARLRGQVRRAGAFPCGEGCVRRRRLRWTCGGARRMRPPTASPRCWDGPRPAA